VNTRHAERQKDRKIKRQAVLKKEKERERENEKKS
jgi:hypothetical protein